MRKDNKHEAGTISHHLIHLLALLVGEVTEDGEHCAAAHEADAGINHGHDQGVTQDWASELVIAAKCYQRTKGYSNRIENLEYLFHKHLLNSNKLIPGKLH